MKKKLFTTLTILVLTFSITACGNDEKGENAKAKDVTEQINLEEENVDTTPVRGNITYIKSQYDYEDGEQYFDGGKEAEKETEEMQSAKNTEENENKEKNANIQNNNDSTNKLNISNSDEDVKKEERKEED